MHRFATSHPLPAVIPTPFGPPHPIARAAAEALQAVLPELDEGKMFGVLVVQDQAGRLGQLWGFSGKWGGWWVPDFVPPVFSKDELDLFWQAGQDALAQDALRIESLETARNAAQAHLGQVEAQHSAQRSALRAELGERKVERAADRAAGAPAGPLEQASREDSSRLRKARASRVEAVVVPNTRLAQAEAELSAARARRAERSRGLMAALHRTYRFPNAAGSEADLLDIFEDPPSGAGDCAAPKLLAAAFRQGLRPIALTEFWWGPPPPAGGRWQGAFYPPCRGRCAVILKHMLDGLTVERPPVFELQTPPRPQTLYEDEAVWVVNKPAGLLSVPGRGTKPTVLSMLGQDDVWAAHRLDLDTSGVMVLCKSKAHCVVLQRQFSRRTVHKRYVAVLDGVVSEEAGQVDLALQADFLDRPRQIHHPQGRPALTRWTRLEPNRVALYPETGRTHQLRVHCAHPKGLGAPIRGDRLYGTPGSRLHLHAERIEFDHPVHGNRVVVECIAPF